MEVERNGWVVGEVLSNSPMGDGCRKNHSLLPAAYFIKLRSTCSTPTLHHLARPYLNPKFLHSAIHHRFRADNTRESDSNVHYLGHPAHRRKDSSNRLHKDLRI